MKKLFTTCVLLAVAVVSLTAAPAIRGIITKTQPDGTQIQVRMWGDEWMSMVTDAQTGECLIQDEQTHYWRAMTDAEVATTSEAWTQSRRKAMAVNNRRNLGGTPKSGSYKIPVLLVQFQDLKFTDNWWSSVAHYDSTFNQKDYDRVAFVKNKKEIHTGSVRKYFNDQSLGQYDPTFDILGPITLENDYAYYGKESGSTHDTNYYTFVAEAIKKAIAAGYLDNAGQKYDSDSDGNVDLVYIIFAGWAQNEGGDENTIWSKTGTFSIKLSDGTYVKTVCSTCERRCDNGTCVEEPEGIGVLVHEYSHALGLPDFYSTSTSDADNLYQRYGMDGWSLMDQGEYNARGYVPGSYTAHERLMLGWISEADLDTVPAVGRDTLLPFATSGKAMIMRNPLNQNEYITLENHYWNDNLWERYWGNSVYMTGSYNSGLLISHVDYDASVWTSNNVNNSSLHQRCNPLPADGQLYSYEAFNKEYMKLYANNDADGMSALATSWLTNYRADIFPGYNQVDTLNNSNPMTVWYTGDSMAINITSLKVLDNGSIELTFGNYVEPTPDPTPDPEPVALEEISATKQPAHRKSMTPDGRICIDGHDLLGRAIK